MACWSAGGALGGEPGHAVADDEAAAVLPGQVPRRHVDQRGDAVAPAEQGDKMQREPGERAVDTRAPGELDDGGPVSDRGHDGFVAVAELSRPAGLAPSRDPLVRQAAARAAQTGTSQPRP